MKNHTESTDLVIRARAFAEHAHGDQRYGDHPYVHHLDAVAENAAPFGELAQVIAYLHDVIEDTAVEYPQIAQEFGDFVADCVVILSDEAGDNRRERKRKTYAKMALVDGAEQLALVVKVADRLANIEASIANRAEHKYRMYFEEHAQFNAAVFRDGLCDVLWQRIDEALARGF